MSLPYSDIIVTQVADTYRTIRANFLMLLSVSDWLKSCEKVGRRLTGRSIGKMRLGRALRLGMLAVFATAFATANAISGQGLFPKLNAANTEGEAGLCTMKAILKSWSSSHHHRMRLSRTLLGISEICMYSSCVILPGAERLVRFEGFENGLRRMTLMHE